jgi:hypothetical protein
MSINNDRPKKPVGADLILPVAASLYAIYYVASVWDFPPEAQRSGIFLATMLLVFTGLYFLRTLVQGMRGELKLDFSQITGSPDGRMARIGFLGLILVYLLVVRWGGFTLTTFAFLFAGSLLAGLRPVSKALIFAAGAAIGGWLFFIVLLGTRFPRGPFEQLVTAIANLFS